MAIKRRSCFFTGHQPRYFSFGFDEEAESCMRLKLKLAIEIKGFIRAGVTTFYTGMALGVDQWAAETILDLKGRYADLQLIAVLSYETQANKWSPAQRDKYFNELLPRCDDVITLQGNYTPDCMYKRNRWLVEHTGYLLAVYEDGGKDGAAFTVHYALERGREIIIIHPDTLDVISGVDFEAMQRRKQFQILSPVNKKDA